jgi:hypothetical protein
MEKETRPRLEATISVIGSTEGWDAGAPGGFVYYPVHIRPNGVLSLMASVDALSCEAPELCYIEIGGSRYAAILSIHDCGTQVFGIRRCQLLELDLALEPSKTTADISQFLLAIISTGS